MSGVKWVWEVRHKKTSDIDTNVQGPSGVVNVVGESIVEAAQEAYRYIDAGHMIVQIKCCMRVENIT